MMPGSKGLNPHELAHKWMKDLGTRPQYEPKSGMTIPRYANNWEDCGSAKHGTIRRHHTCSSANQSCIWGINYKFKNEFNYIGGLFL